jgi:WD40 repeat protein
MQSRYAYDMGPCGVLVAHSNRGRTVSQGHGGWLTGVTVSHDGTVAVTTSGDELGMVWELPSGGRRHTLTGHSGEVSASILTRKAR